MSGVDIQCQTEDAVAAHLGVHGIIIIPHTYLQGIERQIVSFPDVALIGTQILGLRCIVDGVDCQVYSDDTVAAADGEQRVGISARNGQQLVTKGIGGTLTNILIIRARIGIVFLYAGEVECLFE